jgi:glutamate-1-semialdehyde aminotransferase
VGGWAFPPTSKGEEMITKSNEIYERAIKVIPGATQTLSKGADRFVNGVSPKFLSHGHNAHVWDVDGNEYIDLPMGLGAILLGHSIKEVSNRIWWAADDGTAFTLPHYSEVDLAEKLVDIIPCAELVRFCKNGSDATEGAVRIARAVTGRKHIAHCGYHGSHDWSAVTGGLLRGLIDDGYVHKFEYNNPQSLVKVLYDFPCAAVIMEQPLEEPMVVSEEGGINYLQFVSECAHAYGSLFILDEIVTGFRYALGGASEFYNVTPDLACYGKAMANGLPISAIVGKREYMQTLTEGVFFSNTFSGETTAIAAALKTIEIVQRENVIDKLWRLGGYLRTWIEVKAHEAGLKINLRGNAVRSVLEIPDKDGNNDLLAYSLFLQETHKRGVLFGIPIFPCWTHTEEDMKKVAEAVGVAFKKIKEADGDYMKYLEGDPIPPPIIRA